MTQWCARDHGDSEAEGLSLSTSVLRWAIWSLAGPGHKQWFGGRPLLREDATLQATFIKIWQNISSVFILKQTIVECKFFFCILENNGGFYFVLENNCGYVSYLFYFAVIIIVRKVEMHVIYLPSYNTGLMDWTFSLLNLPVDMRTIIVCYY
jgi:hypothetical protein